MGDSVPATRIKLSRGQVSIIGGALVPVLGIAMSKLLDISWKDLLELVKAIGWTKAVSTVFFFGAHAWVYRLYEDRVADRKAEIDRLAAENREYRDRFTLLLDKHMGLKRQD